MRIRDFRTIQYFACLSLGAVAFTACGDDEFTPISKDRGYEYSIKSKSDFADIPCNEKREGREAVVGRDKDSYICKFDYRDSAYIWIGDTDTLTAEGRDFKRAESSSSYSSSYSSSSSQSSGSTISYGTMKDSRDGQTYKTVVVDGVTWMAENLNYAEHETGASSCYSNIDQYCETYGRLYSRDAAMNSTSCEYQMSCDLGEGPIQGVCPSGWHIPTKAEVQSLLDYISSPSALRSTGSSWSYPGTDEYGLSFLGAGNWSDGTFEDIRKYEVMWIYIPSSLQYFLLISGSSDNAEIWDHSSNKYYGTVRCIKGDGVAPASSSSLSSSSYSSSSQRSSSSQYQEITEPLLEEAGTQFNPDIEYGTLTDTRDGKTYKTVEVDGVTWMAENLNYAGNEVGESVCFNDDDNFCKIYGRLYSRDAAMNSSDCAFKGSCNLGSDPIQGVCPDGWHIPTKSEAQDLVDFVSGQSRPLRSAKGWKASLTSGLDTYGLSFLGAGAYRVNEEFTYLGEYDFVWAYYASSDQYYIIIRGSRGDTEVWDNSGTELYNTVRCIKD
ncbi:MAG: hypothetical protein IK012_02465 [Fibrobacter sp.]|uniref:FISUMP domain-containing protein n=1 Tax=Fibrobacter sp. TaxID=35828 RepID=UPI0025BF24BD|nr:FISUMP domain-containing protein [Fibrobacter sp.]MBR4784100.1 hypothetical protein [Fibrobacter sp.]